MPGLQEQQQLQYESADWHADVEATLVYLRSVRDQGEVTHAYVPWIYVGGERGEQELVRRGFHVQRVYARHRNMRVLSLRIKVQPWPSRDIVFHDLLE